MNKNDNKLVLFFGSTPVDGVNRNGEIERLGKWDSEDLHILCFADYCKTHFKDIPAF